MSSEATRAAFKVMCDLGVRTVHGQTHEPRRAGGRPGGRPAEETRELHQRILHLDAKGHTRKEIAEMLDVTASTVGKHLRDQIKAGR